MTRASLVALLRSAYAKASDQSGCEVCNLFRSFDLSSTSVHNDVTISVRQRAPSSLGWVRHAFAQCPLARIVAEPVGVEHVGLRGGLVDVCEDAHPTPAPHAVTLQLLRGPDLPLVPVDRELPAPAACLAAASYEVVALEAPRRLAPHSAGRRRHIRERALREPRAPTAKPSPLVLPHGGSCSQRVDGRQGVLRELCA